MMFKKSLWAAVALTASLDALAATSTVPVTPVVTFPSSDATNVDRTPEFAASGVDANANTKWLVYPVVANHQYLGGQQDGSLGLASFENTYQDVPYSLTTTINGKPAATLRVYPYGKAELLAEDKSVLSQVSIQPDSLDKIQPAREDALIAVRTLNNAMVVNWYLKNLNGSVNWDTNVQAIFINNGEVGIKSGINNWSDDFFTLNNDSVGCNVLGGGSWSGNLASIKTLLTTGSNNVASFSLLCRANTSNVATFAAVTPEAITLPQITSLSSTTNTVTPENLLAASTKHVVQVRTEAAGVYSAYSDAVRFTTRAANTDYAWTYPTDVTFTANETKTLTFTLTNNGTEEGNSTINIRLPFNVLGNVVSGTFSVKVNDGSGCPLNISSGKTTYTCSDVKIPVNGSVTVAVSLALPTTVTAIEYAVDGDYKNLPVVITSNNTAPNNNTDTATESSSSSSGGAFAWPLLLLPLLMLGRNRKAA